MMDTSAVTTFEQSYEAQCDNYKKQIYLLQDKISYYERDYHQNNLKLKGRIKDIEERDYFLQKELTIRDNQIEKMKELLQEKTKKISSLELKIEQLNNQNSNEKNNIFTTIATEREQITTINDNLKEEISSLQQMIMGLKDENEKQSKEINQLKEENELYNGDNSVLLKKIQEYEENYSMHLTEQKAIENNFRLKAEQCIDYEKKLVNYDRQIDEYINNVSNEIKTMIQWVDTYFGFCYPPNFEIPSLINQNLSNILPYIDLDMLKKTLENARIRSNKELNNLESYNQKQKCETNELIISRDKKQSEINTLRSMIQELKEQNNILQMDNESYANEVLESKQILSKFYQSIESISNANDQYLHEMSSHIKNELEEIMKDETFVHYNQIILKNNVNNLSSREATSRQYIFEDVLDRLIHIVTLLKDDYRDLKKENQALSNESLNKKGTCFQEINDLNSQVALLKSQLTALEVSQLKESDEKMLLMNQINMLENTLQSKEEMINQLRRDLLQEKKLYIK